MKRTCLIGLHDSGKSTALAALWFSVTERSDECEWYLATTDRPEQDEPWVTLRDHWLRGAKPDRTQHLATPATLELQLTKNGSSEKVTLTVPDIAGEDYEKLYEAGKFPERHADILNAADHLVLFVRVDDYDHPVRLEPPERVEASASGEDSADEHAFNPSKMYSVAKIVSVLRGVNELCNPDRLTIVLTAWDLVAEPVSPDDLLRERFPLLDQFLRTNYTELRILGLTAQGYNYEDSSSRGSIQLDDIRRIRVVEESEHHDITRVFSWDAYR